VTLEHGEAVGALHAQLPPNAARAGAGELAAPRLVELCFQTAGIVDLAERSVLGLPARIDALRLFRTGAAGPLYAAVRRRQADDGFDARVVDGEGAVLLELSGYRTVALGERRVLARSEPAGEGVPA